MKDTRGRAPGNLPAPRAGAKVGLRTVYIGLLAWVMSQVQAGLPPASGWPAFLGATALAVLLIVVEQLVVARPPGGTAPEPAFRAQRPSP